MRQLLLFLGLVFLSACFRTEEGEPGTLRFIALGDAPYGDPAEVDAPYRALLEQIDATEPPLVIHLGDLHGVKDCGDARLDTLRNYLNDLQAPVLYTPGDNEWTDCGRSETGPFDPLERLSYLLKPSSPPTPRSVQTRY